MLLPDISYSTMAGLKVETSVFIDGHGYTSGKLIPVCFFLTGLQHTEQGCLTGSGLHSTLPPSFWKHGEGNLVNRA